MCNNDNKKKRDTFSDAGLKKREINIIFDEKTGTHPNYVSFLSVHF